MLQDPAPLAVVRAVTDRIAPAITRQKEGAVTDAPDTLAVIAVVAVKEYGIVHGLAADPAMTRQAAVHGQAVHVAEPVRKKTVCVPLAVVPDQAVLNRI